MTSSAALDRSMSHADKRSAAKMETVPLELYSRALDEIFALRQALAYEGAIIEAHLEYRTFPKSRSAIARAQVERMQRSARGEVLKTYAGKPRLSLQGALRQAGAPATLTRAEWEADDEIRRAPALEVSVLPKRTSASSCGRNRPQQAKEPIAMDAIRRQIHSITETLKVAGDSAGLLPGTAVGLIEEMADQAEQLIELLVDAKLMVR